ncbi:MAG: FHA domain-containing protein, partial [Gammaproteobacteria bacterium]
PAVEPVADKPPPAAAPATCLDTLSAEERLAMEETAPEVGITAEEMCREMEAAGAGSVIVHAPPDSAATPAAVPEDDIVGVVVVVALGVLLLVLLGIVAVILVRRRRLKGRPDTVATPVSGARDPEAYLEDIQGTTSEGRVRLGSRPLLIGRVAGTDPEHVDYFVIDKGTVGRRHALIQYRDLAFWLSDQDSVNGTFLNGERISSERRLKHGDRIKFHKYEFQFSMPELEAADHTVFASSHDATIAADATQIHGTVATAAAAISAVPPRHSDEDDMFDITAEGPTEDGDPDEGLFAAADEPARPGVPAADDMFDAEGPTEMPARPVEASADDGGMAGFSNHSATGSGDAFDDEASAFFDDDLGPPVADEDRAASFSSAADAGDDDEFATVLPDAPASADSGVFSESETLLPNAPYADGDTSATAVDISLDEFMETESFYSQMPDDDDRADATLMPEQVPNEVTMTPEYGDMFESTGLHSAADAKTDDEEDDEESESPTRFRD